MSGSGPQTQINQQPTPPEIYPAKPPEPLPLTIGSVLKSIILAPIRLIQAGASRLLGKTVGRLIYQAQTLTEDDATQTLVTNTSRITHFFNHPREYASYKWAIKQLRAVNADNFKADKLRANSAKYRAHVWLLNFFQLYNQLNLNNLSSLVSSLNTATDYKKLVKQHPNFFEHLVTYLPASVGLDSPTQSCFFEKKVSILAYLEQLKLNPDYICPPNYDFGIPQLDLRAELQKVIQQEPIDKSKQATFLDRALDFYSSAIENPHPNLILKQIEVHTHDGAKLDTIEVCCNKLTNPDPQRYLIRFGGNQELYQKHLNDYTKMAAEYKRNIVAFNSRGAGNSSGAVRSQQDLITDGIAQVQRLRDQGIPAKNITLNTDSLGASVAVFVAEYFHDRGYKINLFHSRSFSSLSAAVFGAIAAGGLRKSGHIQKPLWKILAYLTYPFVKLALVLLNYDLAVLKAWNKIPEENKEYIVVRSSRERRSKDKPVDDTIITHVASHHTALKPQRRAKKNALDAEIKRLSAEVEKSETNPQKVESSERLTQLKKERERIKIRKMEATSWRNGHNLDLADLKSRYDYRTTAAHFFKEFIDGTPDVKEEVVKHDKKGPPKTP